jgi:hypothetical protein
MTLKFQRLLPGWGTDSELKRIRSELFRQYGDPKKKHSPRWTFNNMMVHPTFDRDIKYDYIPILKGLAPIIWKLIRKIESLRGTPFELRFRTEPENLGAGWQAVIETFAKPPPGLVD